MRYGFLLALALAAEAQTQIDLRTQAKSVDFSAATWTKPLKTGTALPATCGIGEVFFQTTAPAGMNFFACTAPNTWIAQGGPSFCQDAGGGSAYACNLTPAIAAYTTGCAYWFRANTANSGPATISFNGLGAKAIRKQASIDLAAGDIQAGQWVQLTYDGAYMQMQSPPASAMHSNQSNTVTAGTQDFSGAAHTLPMKSGTVAGRPASCSVGETYFATDAPAGANLYGCTAANTWSAQAGSGGGGGSVTVQSSSAVVGTRPALNLIAGAGIQNVVTDTGAQINIQTALDSAVVQTQPREQSGASLLCASSGGNPNTYQCAMRPTLAAYTTGMVLHWVPGMNGAGGGTTLDIDTLGAVPLKMADGITNPSAADIVEARLYSIWYDGSVFRIVATAGVGAGSGSGRATLVVSVDTAASTCSIVSGSGSCTASSTAGASGQPGVVITHSFGQYISWPVCNQGADGSGPLLGSSTAARSVTDVTPVSINGTTITFSGDVAAQCGVSTGSMGPAGPPGPAGAGNNAVCKDATGSGTTYTCPAPSPGVATLTGLLVVFTPRAANTAAATLNVSGLGARALKQADCATNVAPGALAEGASYLFSYNGTDFCQIAGSANGSSGAVTARAYNSGPYVAISSPTFTPLTFDTNDYDTSSIHSTSSNPSRFTAPGSGYYRFTCAIDTATIGASQQVQFRVNGTTTISCGGGSCSMYDGGTYEFRPWSMELYMNAQDYVECLYTPQTASATPTGGQWHTYATLTQIH